MRKGPTKTLDMAGYRDGMTMDDRYKVLFQVYIGGSAITDTYQVMDRIRS